MRLIVLPCDGIGPEIVTASMAVLDAANAAFKLGLACDYEDVGFSSLEKHGTTLRQEVLERSKTYDGVILGTQSHADYPAPEKGGRNVSAGFRIGMDLYANIRPARTRPFLQTNMRAGRTMDLVVMREATEGFYPDRNMSRGWGEMMLQWLGGHHKMDTLGRAAMAMEEAVDKVLENPACRTRDLGGTMGCQAFAERVAATVAAMG